MERFKVVERETKTKAYSKEGLYPSSQSPELVSINPLTSSFMPRPSHQLTLAVLMSGRPVKLVMCSDVPGHWVDVRRSDITGKRKCAVVQCATNHNHTSS